MAKEKRGEKQTWLNDDETSGSVAPPATRRAVGGTNKEQLTRELASLKLQANTAQKERITASIGMWSVMTPAELLEKPIAIAKKIATDHKGKSKHNFGSPHIQVWRSVLKNMVIHAEAKLLMQQTYDEKMIERALDRVKKEIEMFEADRPEDGHKHIRQCRVKTCKDETKALLHYALSHLVEDMRGTDLAMHVILDFLGGDVLPGSAPASELERQCQRNIDDVKAQLGVK